MDSGESIRLRDLYDYSILDTPPEPNFDRITHLAATIFEKPVCTLSLADTERHWFKSRHGAQATEMLRPMSFCDHTIAGDGVFVVPDTQLDSRFQAAPCVSEAPHFRFYAGAPLITPNGSRIGALCVLDTVPHKDFGDDKRSILANLAHTAVELLEARSRQIQLSRCTAKIAHMACHDPLTGLGNRRLLDQLMGEAVTPVEGGEQVVVHYLDLDGFKAVNDCFGHAAGDLLLRQVADRLRASLHATDQVARIGGDEFAIVQKGVHAAQRAGAFAERLIEAIARPFEINGHRITIGASIGIAVGDDPAAQFEQMLNQADHALYRAKAEGRGHFVLNPMVGKAACSGPAPGSPGLSSPSDTTHLAASPGNAIIRAQAKGATLDARQPTAQG